MHIMLLLLSDVLNCCPFSPLTTSKITTYESLYPTTHRLLSVGSHEQQFACARLPFYSSFNSFIG